MSWIKTILSELIGLFVDDGAFAVTIVAWLIASALVLPRLGLTPAVEGVVLFLGLAVFLVESASRRAGQPR